MSWASVAVNALRPGYAMEMLRKVFQRIERDESAAARAWAQGHAQSWQNFCEELDPQLLSEALSYGARFEAAAWPQLEAVGLDLGGGGAYPLLYFLTRFKRPDLVVETGVAAGWSTAAILEAMEQNGGGRLLSSDFPYFRYSNPERFIGLLVTPRLQHRWVLDTRGDRVALPSFTNLVTDTQIDLFHYDSDKSYAGRVYAMTMLRGNLRAKSTVVMDDIQDNFFFRDFLAQEGLQGWVFEFEGKYLGVVQMH